jgi:uncharacterized protein (DUF952 family)
VTIYHIATSADWTAAQAAGTYTTSTRGRTLAEQGFIHASYADQWRLVYDAAYADIGEPLVLLEIDPGRLGCRVVDEPGAPGDPMLFPHIYGPLPVEAVIAAFDLDGDHPGVGLP